jgi:hypothetical protein
MYLGRVTSINTLPDEVLLEMFDFCVYVDASSFPPSKKRIEEWQSLAHVCRRWRSIVFGSPRRLNLQLVATNKTLVDRLDVWPPLPLVIRGSLRERMDNIITVLLERKDRVDRIVLDYIDGPPWENVLAAMQGPFPELTFLWLISGPSIPVIPDSFLGRSAPRLRFLWLCCIPFPGLPNLLLSATHLVNLYLEDIPHSGYISPDAIVTALSTLTSLRSLRLGFLTPRSHPNRAIRRPPPQTRAVLPVLTGISFKGVYEYLEDLVARIDAPLVSLSITFFNDIVFNTPQFVQFIGRTPMLKPLEVASVVFWDDAACINFSSHPFSYPPLNVRILCSQLDWQVSSLEQVCTSCLPPLSTSEDLYIYRDKDSSSRLQDNIENTDWLELLRPFTAVKNLYLSEEFASHIMPALQELVGGRTEEVLPALQDIFLEGLEASGPVIRQFVSMRRVTSHPIAVSRWSKN